MKKHIFIGVAAGGALILIYAVTLVLLQGSEHALEQTARLWYWLLILATGFGVQVGLFSFLKQGLRERRKSATASVAASGGVSAGSMIACCAHHLTDVLPLIGISGFTAFLVDYQIFFMIIGIMANIVGITFLLETIQRLGLCPRLARWNLNMGLIKKVSMASAIIMAPVAFLILSWG